MNEGSAKINTNEKVIRYLERLRTFLTNGEYRLQLSRASN